MKSTTQFIANSLVLLFISLQLTQGAMAQHTHDHGGTTAWKTGMLRLSKRVWAGDVRLKSGMYHVKHVVDGNTHVIVFKPVTLPGGKGFPMWEEREVVRLECRVEPATKEVRNTKLRLGRNAAGQSVILEIQIAGEKV
jgi:hypothetical protein